MTGDFHISRNAPSVRRAVLADDRERRPRWPAIGRAGVWLMVGLWGVFVLASDPVAPVDDEPASRLVPGYAGAHGISFAMGRAGQVVATTDDAGKVVLHEWNDALSWMNMIHYEGFAQVLAFSPAGRLLAIGGDRPGVVLWEPGPRAITRKVPVPLEQVKALAFSADGQTIAASAIKDGRVVVWDLVAGRERAMVKGRSPVNTLAFSPDGRLLATGDNGVSPNLVVWALESGRPLHVLAGSPGPIRSVAFAPRDTVLASTSACESAVRFWSMQTGSQIDAIAGHKGGTHDLAFSPDGTTLATVGNDGMVRLWDVSSGIQVGAANGRAMALTHVAFAPDGRTIAATAHGDDDIRVWEVDQVLRRGRAIDGANPARASAGYRRGSSFVMR